MSHSQFLDDMKYQWLFYPWILSSKKKVIFERNPFKSPVPSRHSSVGRPFACFVSQEWQYVRTQFHTPPMPAYRYVEEKGSVGVSPELNPGECVTCTPLPSANKAAHSGFEIQRRWYQKSETGVSVAPQKGIMFSNKLLEKEKNIY